jgi:hypothetical protein
VVTKHGEEVAVVVSIDDYRRLTEELPGLKEFLLAAPDLEALEVVGEIRQGVERLRRRDPTRVAPYEAWLSELLRHFTDRLVPVTASSTRSTR